MSKVYTFRCEEDIMDKFDAKAKSLNKTRSSLLVGMIGHQVGMLASPLDVPADYGKKEDSKHESGA